MLPRNAGMFNCVTLPQNRNRSTSGPVLPSFFAVVVDRLAENPAGGQARPRAKRPGPNGRVDKGAENVAPICFAAVAGCRAGFGDAWRAPRTASGHSCIRTGGERSNANRDRGARLALRPDP